MNDNDTLKSLQYVLDQVEVIGKMYRKDKNVSRALAKLYLCVAEVGSAIIEIKATKEAERFKKEKEKEKEEKNKKDR